MAKISEIRPPVTPRTTFAVSLIDGGHQIHAIAQKASFAINMRSNHPQALELLHEQVTAAAEAGAKEENERWDKALISMEVQTLLDDPPITQADDCDIVQVAWRATECVGVEPRLLPGGHQRQYADPDGDTGREPGSGR